MRSIESGDTPGPPQDPRLAPIARADGSINPAAVEALLSRLRAR